jgi:hypothetical protein
MGIVPDDLGLGITKSIPKFKGVKKCALCMIFVESQFAQFCPRFLNYASLDILMYVAYVR